MNMISSSCADVRCDSVITSSFGINLCGGLHNILFNKLSFGSSLGWAKPFTFKYTNLYLVGADVERRLAWPRLEPEVLGPVGVGGDKLLLNGVFGVRGERLGDAFGDRALGDTLDETVRVRFGVPGRLTGGARGIFFRLLPLLGTMTSGYDSRLSLDDSADVTPKGFFLLLLSILTQ